MTKLDQKHAASELAFSTITLTAAALDSAVAAKAEELQLSDPDYAQFKQSVTVFRQQYIQAAQQDAQIAKAAAAAAKPVPTLVPAPAPPSDTTAPAPAS